jgi:hypothetical protein
MKKRFKNAGVFFLIVMFTLSSSVAVKTSAAPFHNSEFVFPLENWHNHSSAIVETPKGNLFVCWFHGSGERQADDVKVEGARLKKGSSKWSERFLLADTPGYPDTNATLFIDPQKRLWLMYPTILANEWHTALMKYKISSDYEKDGAPRWDMNDVLHVTPGPEFESTVNKELDAFAPQIDQLPEAQRERARTYLAETRRKAADKFYRRMGWMTRAHPFVLNNQRLIVPLYSDGFSFSLMAYTDDWGKTWKTSTPLVGRGNIQPSIVQARDGSLLTLMRDNGPAPKRLHMSRSSDRGETWSPVTDSDLPNPVLERRLFHSKTGIGRLYTMTLSRVVTVWQCQFLMMKVRPGNGSDILNLNRPAPASFIIRLSFKLVTVRFMRLTVILLMMNRCRKTLRDVRGALSQLSTRILMKNGLCKVMLPRNSKAS